MTPRKPPKVAPTSARVSDVVWQALIAGAVTCILAGINIWTKQSLEQSAEQARGAAVQAAERAVAVKDELKKSTVTTDKKLLEMKQVAVSTHELVDGGRRQHLELVATLSRELADDKPTPRRIAAAELAEKMLAAHVELEDQTKTTVEEVTDASDKSSPSKQ